LEKKCGGPKDAPEVPGDLILQNAEGIKNKFIF
jgi:hypothetical protein